MRVANLEFVQNVIQYRADCNVVAVSASERRELKIRVIVRSAFLIGQSASSLATSAREMMPQIAAIQAFAIWNTRRRAPCLYLIQRPKDTATIRATPRATTRRVISRPRTFPNWGPQEAPTDGVAIPRRRLLKETVMKTHSLNPIRATRVRITYRALRWIVVDAGLGAVSAELFGIAFGAFGLLLEAQAWSVL